MAIKNKYINYLELGDTVINLRTGSKFFLHIKKEITDEELTLPYNKISKWEKSYVRCRMVLIEKISW